MMRCLYLSLIAFATTLAAEVIPAASSIQEVSLFRDGAVVTRVAETEVPAGVSVIRLYEVPRRIDQSFLQAFLDEGSGARLLRAAIIERERNEKSDALLSLEKELEELGDQLSILFAEGMQLEARQDFARKLSDSFAGQYGTISEGKSLGLEEAEETWRFTASVLASVEDEKLLIARKQRDLEDSIAQKEREISEQRDRDRKLSSRIELTVESPKAGSLGMTVRYLISEARWAPGYELRAEPSAGSLVIHYNASVVQNSGEDWNGIELTLQTTSVRTGGNVPELSPLNLSKWEPVARKSVATVRAQVYELEPFAVSSDMDDGYHATESLAAARISSTMTAFQITLNKSSDVPSREEATLVNLLEESLEADFWSESVPSIDTQAYLRASFTNALDLPFLAGQAQSFVDGVLASKVYLEETQPGEEVMLSLGRDPGIVIERRAGKSLNAETGLISKRRTLERRWILTVKNLHDAAHRVVVVDRFPVTREDQIEIKRISPEFMEIEVLEENADNGIFQWNRTIPAGDSLEVETAYEVSLPRDWQLRPGI